MVIPSSDSTDGLDTSTDVLAFARARKAAADAADLARAGVRFASFNSADSVHPSASLPGMERSVFALARFDPETAGARALAALDDRRFDIRLDHILDGGTATATVDAVLDIADALDLEAAISHVAGQLAELGSFDPLDIRRAKAAGELARGHLALPFDAAAATPARPTRQVVLHVHLSDAALHGVGEGIAMVESVLGRRDLPVTVEQVSDWCASGAASVVVRPVLDLSDRLQSRGHDPTERLREQVIGINPTCVFPYCDRPSRGLDVDHVDPYDEDHPETGGETASDNLAPLCRLHRRAKMFGGWTYTVLAPGEFLWSSPHGLRFHRVADGTTDLTDESYGRRRDT